MASNKAEMADNQWMYSGFFRRDQVTTEWVEKTDVFLKEIFRSPMRMVPECPCAKCKRRIRRDKSEMTKHLRTDGFMPSKDDDDLGYVDLDPNNDDARIDGEAVVNQRDIIMLEKLNEDADADYEEEPPPPSDNEEDMRDSDDETGRQIDYNSDDSYGF